MNRETASVPPLPSRVLDTFVSPRRLFAGFRHHTPVMGALALSTLVALVVAGTLPGELFLEQARDAVTRRGEPVTVTSPPAEIIRWGRYLAMLSALAMHPLLVLAVAGLLTLLFGVLGGGRAEFRQYLAVAAHALLVAAAGSLLAIPLRWATGDADAGWSLGWLMPAQHPFLAVLLSALDPFVLWTLALLALGASQLEPRFSWGRAFAALLGSYLGVAALAAWAIA